MELAVVALGAVVVVGAIVGLRWHPFVALILAAGIVAACCDGAGLMVDQPRAFSRVATAFGESCRKIGLLIAFASIIGGALTASRAAERIVHALLVPFRREAAPRALVIAGFVLGIPVFFDTVFLLLIPIARGLYRQTRKHYVLVLMSIVVGGTMAHSLVPPTPGPLSVAATLGVDFRATLVAGLLIGGLAAFVGYLFAAWIDRYWPIELDPTELAAADSDSDQATRHTDEPLGAKQQAVPPVVDEQPVNPLSRPNTELPPLWASLAPIVVPLTLITLGTCLSAMGGAAAAWGDRLALADKNVVMGIGALLSLGLLHWFGGSTTRRQAAIQKSLSDGGLVLLITAGGGTFGEMIKQTGIGDWIGESLRSDQVGLSLLMISFAIAALVRVAQGSATVAMITAAGIVAPVASQFELPFHSVYLVMSIGCGSKLLPWMNDSGFWLVGRMGGLTVPQTFRTFSLTLTVMGCAGMIATLLAAWLVPLR